MKNTVKYKDFTILTYTDSEGYWFWQATHLDGSTFFQKEDDGYEEQADAIEAAQIQINIQYDNAKHV